MPDKAEKPDTFLSVICWNIFQDLIKTFYMLIKYMCILKYKHSIFNYLISNWLSSYTNMKNIELCKQECFPLFSVFGDLLTIRPLPPAWARKSGTIPPSPFTDSLEDFCLDWGVLGGLKNTIISNKMDNNGWMQNPHPSFPKRLVTAFNTSFVLHHFVAGSLDSQIQRMVSIVEI